jgi:hypothetical protein
MRKKKSIKLTEAGVFVDQKALVITPELYHVKKHIVNGARQSSCITRLLTWLLFNFSFLGQATILAEVFVKQ